MFLVFWVQDRTLGVRSWTQNTKSTENIVLNVMSR